MNRPPETFMSETVTPRRPTRPRPSLPAGACDSHNHVFGPYERFPLGAAPSFPMPLAPRAVHLDMLDTVGAERALLVQPSQYGIDVSALLDALKAAPDRLRGIGAARADITDAALSRMDAAGVRGLRFVEARNPDGGARPGAVDSTQMRLLAPRLKSMGWHAQIWAAPSDLEPVLGDVESLGVPLVLDHMGMVDVRLGVEQPYFQKLLGLLREGLIWVKLSVCRVGASPDFEDARPFHDALVDANPNQLVWASDWPFIRLHEHEPDVGRLLDLFMQWIGDAHIARAILSDNPARLFDFAPAGAEISSTGYR